jgi:hypothetical protein
MSPFLAKVALACFAAQGPLAGGKPAPAGPENLPRGVVIDFRGPPEGGKYSWVEVFYLEGRKEPKRIEVSGGGYSSHALHGVKWAYEIEGFVVRRVGDTQLEIVGLKMKDGKLLRVRKMEFQSPSLPTMLLPRVHNPGTQAF